MLRTPGDQFLLVFDVDNFNLISAAIVTVTGSAPGGGSGPGSRPGSGSGKRNRSRDDTKGEAERERDGMVRPGSASELVEALRRKARVGESLGGALGKKDPQRVAVLDALFAGSEVW